MNKENQLQKGQRCSISEKYIDSEGNEQIRATRMDFQMLPARHIETVTNLPSFEQDKEIREWMEYAAWYYDRGEYAKAHQYLTWSLKRMPALDPYIFYYMRVCERVLAIPLTQEQMGYEAKLARYRALPKWLRWTMLGFEFHIRCKWCGQYTRYVPPDVPTFGFATFSNSCLSCDRMYPMPSWLWDSPDGRAYSYYRMSFSNEEFYEEFERDYDPKPLCQHRQK
jgi:hypothetical protein